MTDSPIDFVVCGLGDQGRLWVRELSKHPSCRITAMVDPSEKNQAKAKAMENLDLGDTPIVAELAAVIGDVDADAVMDVTPPSIHASIAAQAADAGLHVLGEKPLSDDMDAARAMAARSSEAGTVHMVTQNYRFERQPITFRRLIKDGLIGTPGQLDVRFYMPWADLDGSHYVTEPYMMINDMMVHHFDMMRFVLNADPVSVRAVTWNHPWGWHKGDASHIILLEFPDGLMATHLAIACSVGQATDWNGDWRIEGDRGSLAWENGTMKHVHAHRADNAKDDVIPLDDAPPTREAIIDEFVGAIREKGRPMCSAEDHLSSLAMCFAAIQSAKDGGRAVTLDEV